MLHTTPDRFYNISGERGTKVQITLFMLVAARIRQYNVSAYQSRNEWEIVEAVKCPRYFYKYEWEMSKIIFISMVGKCRKTSFISIEWGNDAKLFL